MKKEKLPLRVKWALRVLKWYCKGRSCVKCPFWKASFCGVKSKTFSLWGLCDELLKGVE